MGIGAFVRAARRRNGLTQIAMGERLESALGLDDFADQTVGVLADR